MSSASPAAPYGPQTLEIRRFLQRLAALSAAEWDAAAARFDALQGSGRFAAADRALSAAVAATGREPERDAVLGPLVQLVAVRDAEDGTDHAPDAEPALAAVAEAALAAVLALLVRDVLPASAFATLYAPFADTIPVPERAG